MAEEKRIAAGPAAQQIARNLTRLRGKVTFVELSARLAELGRPIPVLGLRRIESCERRVDIDDVIALGRALNVPPVLLIFPLGEEETSEILPGHLAYTWSAVKWFTGEGPFPVPPGQIRDMTVEDETLPGRLSIELYRVHQRLLEQWDEALLEGASESVRQQRHVQSPAKGAIKEALVQVRLRMREKGILTPPLFDIGLVTEVRRREAV